MTNKELLINRINQLSEKAIASLLDAVMLMASQDTLTTKPTAPTAAPMQLYDTGISVGNRDFFVSPVQRHLSRLPILLCQTTISRQKHDAK